MPYGNLLADVVQGSTANTPPVFKDGNGTTIGTLCRAWVNFNGTGTVAIRASFNVSSITDNGTGNYTVNFTNAMPDANYSVSINTGNTSWSGTYNQGIQTFETSNLQAIFRTTAGAQFDPQHALIAVFR
jgi:hypothetical protein